MKKSHGADERWTVKSNNELLKFLFEKMPDRSKKAVKAMLGRGQVFVNDASITQFDTALSPGDVVEIRTSAPNKKVQIRGLRILHEDEHVIVIDKDAGLLSIASNKDNTNTAYRLLSDYVKNVHPRNRIFVVHRLDRETSGVMVFAKSKEVQQKLQNNWKQSVRERSYIALVEGTVYESGTIKSWLTEDQTLKMHSSDRENNGQKAITHYEVLKSNRVCSLLKVSLETGRKNQIRVHMESLGHPVVGDKKYGAKTNPFRRIGLHAHALSFTHPVTKEQLRFESDIPKPFLLTFK